MAVLDGVTNAGIKISASIKRKAQIAHAGIITAAQIYIASRRRRVQEQYIDIAEGQRQHYASTYRPLEDQELKDALGRFDKDTNLEDMIDHITRSQIAYRISTVGQEYKAIQGIGEYHTGMMRQVIEGVQIADIVGFVFASIIGEYKLFAEEQDRLDKGIAALIQALARGRGLGSNHLMLASVNSNYLNALNFEYDYAAPITEIHDQPYQPIGLAAMANHQVMPVNPDGAIAEFI